MKTSAAGSDRKGIFVLSGLAALVGGLCCLTPVVLVLLGLASISAAASLGNVLYGDYHWEFRLVALAFLILALVIYFRRQGICTLDQARRERNRIINTSILVLIFAVGMYIFWTYIAVHWFGVWAGLPWRQYDEGWAVPASAAVLAAAVILYLIRFRRSRKAREASRAAS
jgi:membrane protein implicated in regulation of membrane protease activity